MLRAMCLRRKKDKLEVFRLELWAVVIKTPPLTAGGRPSGLLFRICLCLCMVLGQQLVLRDHSMVNILNVILFLSLLIL